MRRDYLGMDFVFYAGGYEILLLYLNNIANSGITELFITEQYTNIEGGLGVFSSRYIMPVENLILSDVALDSLACGRITRHLNFKSSVTHADYPGCGN